MSALSDLRKIASEGRTTFGFKMHQPSIDFQGVSGKAQEEMEEYLATCHKRKRPKFTGNTNLPSVSVRISIDTPHYKNTDTVFAATNIDLNQAHFQARRALVMHHRASHERLRSTIISTGERIMNVISSYDVSATHTKSQLIEFVTQTMTEEIQHHRETLVSHISSNSIQFCHSCNQSNEPDAYFQ